MARRSQCSSAGDDPLNPNYLPPHYREEYRLAVDALVEDDLDGYYQFLLKADVVDFLSSTEIEYIRGAVQVPQSGEHLEQRVLECGADGSSDTYWPLHSDLEAPGLDLGWPQTHRFIGPTEVTTLVNPPEPDMPSIKEQARRLIKNAKQVVAIVMDMFTDVDIFADILAAAMRNVAVYILLDKENVHHFINMAANCRVDLQSIQFLRIRTVSGITYHCRSGKSFTGQMMDRFLLTDCRAVLSGNYSFMWSFEKLHRCMAHLFLGQLVSTFDEEFRILFAQSEPLLVDNMLPPLEDFSQSQKRKYPCERALLYREPKKYLSLDTAHPDEWVRHPHEDRTDLDWRMMPHKRPDVQYGPAEVYGRFSSQQPRLDPPFDQYSSRIPMMDNPAFKRHSYAEGGHGRYSLPFLQPQDALEPETQGRQFHRGQQPYPDYSGYERFWSQDFDSADQYCEPSLPPELERLENFDPVLNYLSSTRNTDFEQAPEKIPAADLHFGSSQPRRLSLGQPYACQTSPTSSNPSDQKHLFFESNPDRKDPAVKRGLRNWRISSFLSASDHLGDDGRPSSPPNAPDPFEDPSASVQKTAAGIDLAVPKIPNVREFKIPALPRASQMPSYAKTTTREPPKKAPDETTTAESRSTPTPSESSSTTEGEKTEEAEPKEPKTVQREESFRRKYNPAVQRSSRLRSSLIFSSLDQQHPTQDNKGATGQQDQESDKNEAEQKKPSYISPVFGQRRSTPREPLEWSRYLKSSTFDNSATDAPKADDGDGKVDGGESKTNDKDSEKDKGLPEKADFQEPSNAPVLEQGNSTAPTTQPKSSVPKTDSAVQPKKPAFMTPVYVDMNDPDQRFLFFKELAAKRKAEKAAEAEQNKPPTDPKNNATMKEEPKEHLEKKPGTSQHLSEKHVPAEDAGKTDSTESLKAVSQHSDQSKEDDCFSKKDAKIPQSSKDEQTRNSTESEKNEPKKSQSGGSLHVSAETQTPEGEKTKLLNSTVKKGCTVTQTTPVPDRPTEETPHLKSTSHHPPSLTWSKTTLSSCEKQDQSEQSCEKQDQSDQSCEKQDQPEQSCEEQHQSEQSSSSDINLTVSGSQVSPGLETKHPEVASADSLTSNMSSLHVKESSSQSDLSMLDKTEPAEDNLHPVSSLMSSDNGTDVSPVSDSILNCGEPSVGLEEGCHSHSDSSQLIGSVEQVTSDGTAPSTGTPSPHLPDQQGESKSDQNEPIKMSVLLAGPQIDPSISQTPSFELCSSPETLKTPGTPTESGVPPLTATVLTQETTTQRPSDFFSPHPPTPTSPTSISPKMASPRKTHPTTLINPTMTTAPATTSPTAISQTPTSPSMISQTPTSPTTISQTPTSPSTISQTPTSPTTISQTPTSPSTISQTPTSPTKRETSDGDLLPQTAEGVCPMAPPAGSPVPPENTNGKEDISSECETTNQNEPSDVTVDSTQTTDQVVGEKTDDADVASEEAVPPPVQSKHQKSVSSRYHSSTSSVLSSSNLRDDTKLLLEQISANSQNRNEAPKESAVTDDEKEDEADKNAKREKNQRGIQSLSRAPPKSSEEREKLLERIQSMRKERKVYSRFEMGP